MKCLDLMKTEIETCRELDTVLAAARCMRDVNIGFLPVCDPEGHPVGALTDRDLALRVCADDRRASATPVKDVMTREIVTCRDTDDISEAEERMARHRKSRMMIVDEDGRLVGVISLSDIVEEEDDTRVVETLRHVAERDLHA